MQADDKVGLSAREITVRNARRQGEIDRHHNRAPDPTLYGARLNSAWAQWYFEGYDARP